MFKKSKSFASELLPKSFKGEKCKISLKLVRTRIMLTKNKKGIQVKQMRRDIATLLAAGQDQTALIRVEHVIREEKNLSVFEIIDIYCELIISQLPIIESRKNCPIDLREAISSVIFASFRCADIPEIIDVRKHFVAKYGKEFITAALEVRPESGVSCMLVDKLSASAPDSGTKRKALSSIAEEFNVKWDKKSFEGQMATDDSLAEPITFASACQMNEQSERMSQNDVVSKAPSLKDSSASSINTTSVPCIPSNSKVSENRERRPGREEVNSAHSTETASLNQQNSWNMGFKDATSAAQAAAESAERASVAARAAAELSRRESASYNEIKQNIKESVPIQFDEIKHSNEVAQARSGKGSRRTCDNTNVIRSFSYSPYSNEVISNDELLEANKKNEGKPYGYATFDDSDGQSSDGGDVIKDIINKGEMKSTNSHHNCIKFTSPDRYRKSSVSGEISGSQSPTEISSRNSDTSQGFFRMRKEKAQASGLSGVSSFSMSPSLLDSNYPDMSNDCNTEEKEGLSLGRLTGGFRNKGFPDPPYLRGPLPDASVPSRPIHTRTMEECAPSQEKSFASSEASYQGRHDEEPNLHGCRPDASPSGAFPEFDRFKLLDSHHSVGRRVHVVESSLTLNKAARNNSDAEEQTVSHQNKASTHSENLVYDSYSLKPMARDSNLYGSRSYGRSKSALLPPKEDINMSLSIERNVSISERAFSSHEVSNEQRQTVRTNRESRLRVPLDYFCQDGDKAEPQYPLGFRNDRCANFSRNRDLPSATETGGALRFNARSSATAEMESEFSGGSLSSETLNTENRGMHLEYKDNSRSSQQSISMTPSHQNKLQVNTFESSFKGVSHVHPKLPDYDTIVAHFQSLRANRH